MDANTLSTLAENSFSVFVLYLVISSNFLAPLFSCRLQTQIEESMIIRHLLGFLTLTFFVVIASKTQPFSFAQVIGLSGFFYLWFLLTTRMHLHFWMVVIALVGTVYLIHLYQSDLTSDTPTEEEAKRLTFAKQVLTSFAGIFTFLGFFSYLGEKRLEYGSKFTYSTFFLGAASCKGASPKVSFLDSLEAGLFGVN
jgi:hypothetical protein